MIANNILEAYERQHFKNENKFNTESFARIHHSGEHQQHTSVEMRSPQDSCHEIEPTPTIKINQHGRKETLLRSLVYKL